ncbi:MAG: hypothetical protein LUE87_11275 [Lachnospiraceae bacterium]|nr:hypothetical protein [Lachnospiraceae bacterium]
MSASEKACFHKGRLRVCMSGGAECPGDIRFHKGRLRCIADRSETETDELNHDSETKRIPYGALLYC